MTKNNKTQSLENSFTEFLLYKTPNGKIKINYISLSVEGEAILRRGTEMLNAKNQVNILSNIFLEIFELIPSPHLWGEG